MHKEIRGKRWNCTLMTRSGRARGFCEHGGNWSRTATTKGLIFTLGLARPYLQLGRREGCGTGVEVTWGTCSSPGIYGIRLVAVVS